MKLNRISGIILILACIEIVSLVVIAQHLYPNYSLNNNYISDLGVGSTAWIFNSAIALFGVLVIIASFLIWKHGKYTAMIFSIAGLGAIGVGLMPETTGIYHIIAAIVAFGTTAVIMLLLSKSFKGRIRYYSIAAGIIAVLILLVSAGSMLGIHLHVGLGHGGFEEILFYDEMIWLLVFGISLLLGGQTPVLP